MLLHFSYSDCGYGRVSSSVWASELADGVDNQMTLARYLLTVSLELNRGAWSDSLLIEVVLQRRNGCLEKGWMIRTGGGDLVFPLDHTIVFEFEGFYPGCSVSRTPALSNGLCDHTDFMIEASSRKSPISSSDNGR